ncbi:pyridoxamine 5'-phosphate oxidase family protein [Rhizobium sp. WYJ-E13]|uniref:2Fe-2S iron-sulfur cluster-binding protein n=1 Tax=Rhizobium sp. WYJ-E13 TaxID=2849093 RepID=UPI001C1EC573|nr:pyridoxamine 5'-phosphate oxidase family protein [Rhizobium sp. WYJ-E13]QWW72288.1 pyridoxamine 5'-phosphate oxidase family protein [Rhizobium sp. WYJ-E13]
MNPSMSSSGRSPWHQGELEIQGSVGVVDKMDDIGRRFIRDHLIEQHRAFYPQLPFLVVGSVDGRGDPWASIICGRPGFSSARDEHTFTVAAPLDASDPASAGFVQDEAVGILGIELHTRRRNRLNGRIERVNGSGFDLHVVQSYGNCPRYIQLRDFSFVRDPTLPFSGQVELLDRLDERATNMIRASDTLFVASYAEVEAQRQVDVSHRGGRPGFVRVAEDGLLTIPDFAGNLFFNTLGNILLNGRAGLTFADYVTGDILQLSGTAEVVLQSPEIEAFQGAERLWTFRPERIVRRCDALALRWSDQPEGESPYSIMTGDWAQAEERLKAKALATAWRSFRIERIVEENSHVRSFYLSPSDGAGLIPHRAGQHLPIRVRLPDAADQVIRNYTLSVAPSDNAYRISVKKEGAVSSYLHQLQEGSVIEARAPAGLFTIDPLEPRPVVLLAAGVGITPMIAMLRHIVYEGRRKQRMRRTWIFYSARSVSDQGFSRELSELVEASNGAIRLVRTLSNPEGAVTGVDFDEAGRITIDLLKKVLPFDSFDFYLCGPPAFMQDIYSGLRTLRIPDESIFAETFGPASIARMADTEKQAEPLAPVSTRSVHVIFTRSSKEARWTPGSGTLLEFAEERGLSPAFSCRSGTCGTCAIKLDKGSVTYTSTPTAPIEDGEVLICCAYPADEITHGPGALQLSL